jgi:hypothetical protein
MVDVCIFRKAVSNGAKQVFDALPTCMSTAGDSVRWSNAMYEPCDVAVHASGVKGGRLRDSALSRARAALIENMPERRLIIESPAFREGLKMPCEWWRMSWNSFLRDGDYCNENCPSDRFDAICELQGIQVRDWREGGGHIVVMMQKPSDASCAELDMDAWTTDVVTRLMAATDRDIIVRQHPLDRRPGGHKPTFFGARMSWAPLERDLEGAWAVVTYTSLSSIESICAGIPTWVLGEGSLAWPVASGHSLATIESPERPERMQWLYDLAYTQWHVSEIKEGIPWKRLRPRYF